VPVLESSVQVAVTGVTVAWLCCFFFGGARGIKDDQNIIMIPEALVRKGGGGEASLGCHEVKVGTLEDYARTCKWL